MSLLRAVAGGARKQSLLGDLPVEVVGWRRSSLREPGASEWGRHVAAFTGSGPVFACIAVRALAFSEGRFVVQELVDGRPGRLMDHPSLRLLDRPWPNGTTGELLARMEQDASIAGNCFLTVVEDVNGRRIRRLAPERVTIVTGTNDAEESPFALDAVPVGYLFELRPGRVVLLDRDQVAHYSPLPDPEHQWRGMSWLTPLLREIDADKAATHHKLQFFRNGATLQTVVTYDRSVKPETFQAFVKLFEERHAGTDNAYRTLHLGGGADVKVVGTDLRQLEFRAVQAAGETRIAAAAGVGAIMARFSEGLQGSSLNQGNYAAAKRQFADMTLRPLWRTAAASLSPLVSVPNGHRLWIDVRDVEFLKEDRTDAVAILERQAQTVRTLVDAGFDPDAVVDAVEAGDLSRLAGAHSGLYSVQLQRPGEEEQ